MKSNLRKVKLTDVKGVFVGDVTNQRVYQFAKEKSTGTVYAYEDLEGSVWTLDGLGMPDKYYTGLSTTEDYDKFDVGPLDEPNYIPWPKGVKEPK